MARDIMYKLSNNEKDTVRGTEAELFLLPLPLERVFFSRSIGMTELNGDSQKRFSGKIDIPASSAISHNVPLLCV